MNSLLAYDRAHLWHPYARMPGSDPRYLVQSASGCVLHLADGRQLIDGISSWWSALHGYNQPILNQVLQDQLSQMAHVMFAGLTHPSAIELGSLLAQISGLPAVFFSDSGSVAVEVAMKMALHYQQALGQSGRNQILALHGGYHGDTLGAMSVSEPEGMHQAYRAALPNQLFAPRPNSKFGMRLDDADEQALRQTFAQHGEQIAALIVEPIAQCAGGMHFYSADYLRLARELCDQHGVLLILDEIATGFGRTGKLFAMEHAGIKPDILCLGKALTGGYLGMAATLASARVAATISHSGAFMHGPTFMANPLACAVALASTRLLLESPWQQRISTIEQGLRAGLEPCRALPQVADVRVLGAIGVVELSSTADNASLVQQFVELGVWIRPFGNLVYLMPPYVIPSDELAQLTAAICKVLGAQQ